MQKSTAFGLFIVLLIIGSLIIISNVESTLYLYTGMFIIGFGILNFAYNLILKEHPKKIPIKTKTTRKTVKKRKRTTKKKKR
ncbi:MAG: hypothetical protein J7K26_00780 [Candidatus Aenigmarchaeota archaeon]|nr:hypothetical protein [Candidatus Aenigmarchaeota archaeon]